MKKMLGRFFPSKYFYWGIGIFISVLGINFMLGYQLRGKLIRLIEESAQSVNQGLYKSIRVTSQHRWFSSKITVNFEHEDKQYELILPLKWHPGLHWKKHVADQQFFFSFLRVTGQVLLSELEESSRFSILLNPNTDLELLVRHEHDWSLAVNSPTPTSLFLPKIFTSPGKNLFVLQEHQGQWRWRHTIEQPVQWLTADFLPQEENSDNHSTLQNFFTANAYFTTMATLLPQEPITAGHVELSLHWDFPDSDTHTAVKKTPAAYWLFHPIQASYDLNWDDNQKIVAQDITLKSQMDIFSFVFNILLNGNTPLKTQKLEFNIQLNPFENADKKLFLMAQTLGVFPQAAPNALYVEELFPTLNTHTDVLAAHLHNQANETIASLSCQHSSTDSFVCSAVLSAPSIANTLSDIPGNWVNLFSVQKPIPLIFEAASKNGWLVPAASHEESSSYDLLFEVPTNMRDWNDETILINGMSWKARMDADHAAASTAGEEHT